MAFQLLSATLSGQDVWQGFGLSRRAKTPAARALEQKRCYITKAGATRGAGAAPAWAPPVATAAGRR